ncbi:GNAT family N-acetyltransferase [Streptosporangium sp. NPDC049304]|uniref:GNAT family N-acetyltransferase n=1 Tax=Streptosporangium sp. NPDC049304 TaxID=3154830 RepID=UPI0034497BC3
MPPVSSSAPILTTTRTPPAWSAPSSTTSRSATATPTPSKPTPPPTPHGLFLVGYLNTVPVTCGGYRTFDEHTRTIEIKKMYTVPRLRGLGLGERILTTLENHAAQSGAQRSILETGVRNTAALALYTGIGYQPAARYVNGRDPAINRAFIKELASSTPSAQLPAR